MYLYPLLLRKHGHSTSAEVNVICLVEMYTNKVIRLGHMFVLDSALWVERLIGRTVCGSPGQERKQQMVCFSLKACYF